MKSNKKKKNVWYKKIVKDINMKNRFNDNKKRFNDFLELPPEVAGNTTKITIIEDSNVLIEGYKQIIDYYDDYIKIRTHNVDVIVDGRNLDIKEITDAELIIVGTIYSLNYKK